MPRPALHRGRAAVLATTPFGGPRAGIGEGGDDPPFAGHARGRRRRSPAARSAAMEAILRGDVEHAFHPGGGLHHAMPDRASGFCIYDDPALAIARARRDGLRVLYIDLDVHHGDGVQAIFCDDPGVLTISIHESGRYLFPGTRRSSTSSGRGTAAGTSVNMPLRADDRRGGVARRPCARCSPSWPPRSGRTSSCRQHGADSHAWDPLAHLRVTTTAMGEAARLVDAVAHRHAGGRWLATGGGGYDAYRVVPRIVEPGLAGRRASRGARSDAGRRGASAGPPRRARYGQAPLPRRSTIRRTPGSRLDATQAAAEARSLETAGAGPAAGRAAAAARGARPRLVGSARRRRRAARPRRCPAVGGPVVVPSLDAAAWSRLLAGAARRRAVDADRPGTRSIAAAIADGAIVSAALAGRASSGWRSRARLRRAGIATCWRSASPRATGDPGWPARSSAVSPADYARGHVAERDPVEPIDRTTRATIARRLLERRRVQRVRGRRRLRAVDPLAIRAAR